MKEIKMKKITPKTWKERSPDSGPKAKNYPSGYMDFDDNKDLKSCVIGSEIIIKQKVVVTRISEEGIGYDIHEMGAGKKRTQREVNKK